MGRPSKPLSVIKSEKIAHRTKAELKLREESEKALLTGERMKESKDVKANPNAHEKFKRIMTLLDKIQKTDALYETVINRYCTLYAETLDIIQQRVELVEVVNSIKDTFTELKENGEIDADNLSKITQSLMNTVSTINKLDDALLKKRKMLLDIEKENIMTIAAALRSIPKTPELTSGPSLKDILGG